MEYITVIIETPKGKGHKYDFEPAAGYLKLKKILPAGLVFPFDFGFIPDTQGGDGDPLDVLVISEIETFPGCAVDCRIIGAIKATQMERNGDLMRNDRFIAVPEVSQFYAEVQTLAHLPEQITLQLEQFFINYNAQAGKHFNPLRRIASKQAMKMIEEARNSQPLNKLITLFLPVYDRKGNAFPKKSHDAVNKKLQEKFGGLTVYSRFPATGFWEPDERNALREGILVYEVMAAELDKSFWTEYKTSLLEIFQQEEIIIRCTDVTTL